MRAKDNRTRGAMRPALLFLALTMAAVAVFMGSMAVKNTAKAEVYGGASLAGGNQVTFNTDDMTFYFSKPTDMAYIYEITFKKGNATVATYYEEVYESNLTELALDSSTVNALRSQRGEIVCDFYAQGQDGGDYGGKITFNLGETVPLPTPPEKEGYNFVGWYYDSAYTRPYDGAPIYADTQLFAKYELKKYIVTIDANGGSGAGSGILSVEHGSNLVSALSRFTLTRTGYMFSGWAVGGSVVGNDYTVTRAVTAVAQWQRITYSLTFDSNSGNSISPLTVDYGTTYGAANLPTPVREGYKFNGWKSNGAFVGVSAVIDGNKTLIADWTINTYTVTYDAAGGYVANSSESVTHGEKVTPPAPEREGYNFLGWFVGDTEYNGGAITSDTTISAKWQIKTYTVTFIVDGEPFKTVEVKHGDTLQLAMKEANLTYYNAYNDSGEVIGKGAVITENVSVLVGEMSKEERFGAFMANNTWVLWTLGGVAVAGILAAVVACVVAHKRK